MCIAIVKPRGVSLAEDRLRLCFENNPDGAGFAIAKDGRVEIHKGYTTVEAFLAAYRAHCVDHYSALVHFRITTRGDNGIGNHHPFPLSVGALIHNGTIGWLGRAKTGHSDTRLFADLLFDQREGVRRPTPRRQPLVLGRRPTLAFDGVQDQEFSAPLLR